MLMMTFFVLCLRSLFGILWFIFCSLRLIYMFYYLNLCSHLSSNMYYKIIFFVGHPVELALDCFLHINCQWHWQGWSVNELLGFLFCEFVSLPISLITRESLFTWYKDSRAMSELKILNKLYISEIKLKHVILNIIISSASRTNCFFLTRRLLQRMKLILLNWRKKTSV